MIPRYRTKSTTFFDPLQGVPGSGGSSWTAALLALCPWSSTASAPGSSRPGWPWRHRSVDDLGGIFLMWSPLLDSKCSHLNNEFSLFFPMKNYYFNRYLKVYLEQSGFLGLQKGKDGGKSGIGIA